MATDNNALRSAPAQMLLDDTLNVIRSLPGDDAVAAVRQLTGALVTIEGATLTLQQRYDAISLIDTPMFQHTGELLREYLQTSRHTWQREADLWQSAYHGWRDLAAAYATCVQLYVDGGKFTERLRLLARTAAARAIRALRRKLQWSRVRYAPPAASIWENLATVYGQIEREGVAEELAIYEGEASSVQREFVKTLALGVLSCENLMPPEHALATFLVNRYANDFVLSETPFAECAYVFDLTHPQAPQSAGKVGSAGANLRYFGASGAVASLETAIRELSETQTVPASLGFTQPVEAVSLAPLLRQIQIEWSGQSLERRHPREKTNARMAVVPGFKQIVSVLEEATTDPFDFTDRASGENWFASDISPDGFGVMMPAVTGDWVSVGSVMGVEGGTAGGWDVGMVRHVRRLEDGQQHIGVQVLCRDAQAVHVMRDATSSVRITQRMPIDHAILLTRDAANQKEIELLVSDAAIYGAGNVHVHVGDSVLLVKLHDVLEVTSDCTRIRFTVLSIET